MDKLEEVCTKLGKAHKAQKEEKDNLENGRNEFFTLATETLEKTTLAKMVVEWPEGVDPLEYTSRYYPGWRAVKLVDHKVQLEEDPALKKFVFVNPVDGKVYQRNAIQGQPQLDDELLREKDPDLWIRITDVENRAWLGNLLYEMNVEPDEIDEILITYDAPRVLKPADELDPEDLAAITDYLVPSPITLRLESPRKATDEELQEN